MNIPTVTPDDLLAFHAKHFPFQVEQHHESQHDEPSEELYYDPETDHLNLGPPLGYYPDGTPRYLTDEQIEIMRHTELWTAYKKMYLQTEILEAEADSPPSPKPERHTNHSMTPEMEVRKLKRPDTKRGAADALPYDDEDVEAWEKAAAANAVDGETDEGKRKRAKVEKGDKGKGRLVEKKGGFVWPVLGVVPKEV